MPAIIDKEEMRLSILQGFERCAAEKPIAKITLRDIAKEVGVNHATLLYYFESKDEIVSAYAGYIARQYMNMPLRNNNQSESIVDALYKAFDIDEKYKHTKIFVQLYGLSVHNEEVRNILKDVYENYRKAIKEEIRSRYGSGYDAQADALLMMVEGILIYRMSIPISEEEIKAMLSTITFSFE